jgi:hypothetical protein
VWRWWWWGVGSGTGSVKYSVALPIGTEPFSSRGDTTCIWKLPVSNSSGHPVWCFWRGFHSPWGYMPGLYLKLGHDCFFTYIFDSLLQLFYYSTWLWAWRNGVRFPDYPIQLHWLLGFLLGVERSDRDVEHSPLSSARYKTEWSHTSTPAVCRYSMYGTSLSSAFISLSDSVKSQLCTASINKP